MIPYIRLPSRPSRPFVVRITLAAAFACSAVIGPNVAAQTQKSDASRMPGYKDSSLSSTTAQRLARDQVKGIVPMARIANRLQNRIPSRLQTRIDQDYRGPVTGAEQIKDAENQTRVAGSPR